MFIYPIQQNILSTLAFFNIFQFPLTDFEIWKFILQQNDKTPQESNIPTGQEIKRQNNDLLNSEVSLFQIINALEELKKDGKVGEKNGFYALTIGNNFSIDEMAKIRMKRYRLSQKKFRRALWVSKILAGFPTIKMIAICNSLAISNADKSSDIDLFIITKKSKIWTTRFITLAILKMLGLRPRPNKSSNKICASFFISENNLNLENISFGHGNTSLNPLQRKTMKTMLASSPLKEGAGVCNISEEYLHEHLVDIYLLYWIATLIPIYNKEETYENFLEKNHWIRKYLPNIYANKPENEILLKDGSIFYKIMRGGISLLNLLSTERMTKWLQLKIMPEHLKRMANKNTNVIISNEILKFHDKDRRREYYEKWANNTKTIINHTSRAV